MAILRLQSASDSVATLADCPPTSFAELGIKERQDIEAWLVAHPEVIDEEMVVVSSEYDAFDQTSERLTSSAPGRSTTAPSSSS